MAGPGRSKNMHAKPKNGLKSLLRVLTYLKKHKIGFSIVLIMIAISSASQVAQSYFIKPIIDNCIMPYVSQKEVDYSMLIKITLILIGVVALGGIANYIYSIIVVKIAASALVDIRCDLFKKVERLPLKYHDTNNTGEIMSRFTNDIDALREMISRTIPEFISTLLMVSGIFIMLIILDYRLTLLVILMLLIMFAVIRVSAKAGAESFKEQQAAIGKVNSYIEEMISGTKVIKVFCHEDEVRKKFEDINNELMKKARKANIVASILRPIMGNLSTFSFVVITAVGTVMVASGAMLIGTLGAFIKYARSFSMPLTNLSEQFSMILSAVAGAERIFEVMDETCEIDEGHVLLVNVEEDSNGNLHERDFQTGIWAWKYIHTNGKITYLKLQGNVEFEDVTFGYNDKKTILKGLNIVAKPGEKVAFVGSTGAGKTTITNLINRFYEIEKGKIRYDGINIKKIKKDDLRHSLAMVLQDTHLFTGTIKDNIKFGKLNATDEEVVNAAKIANAHQFIMHLPDKYETIITADGASLSQGERQLLAIARAAIANPPVLILDEATSSIDTRTEALIQKGMDTLMKGRTVFVIAHRLSTIRNADSIMLLENGEIIERGNHKQLMDIKGKYYELQKGLFDLN